MKFQPSAEDVPADPRRPSIPIDPIPGYHAALITAKAREDAARMAMEGVPLLGDLSDPGVFVVWSSRRESLHEAVMRRKDAERAYWDAQRRAAS